MQTVHVAKDANGAASITNVHLLREEGDGGGVRLLACLAQERGPGRIEARGVGSKVEAAAVTTLEAATVSKGQSIEYGAHHVVVVTVPEQTTAVQSAACAEARKSAHRPVVVAAHGADRRVQVSAVS